MKTTPLFDRFGCIVESDGRPLHDLSAADIHAAMGRSGVVLLRGFAADTASFEELSRMLCDVFYIHPDPKRVAVGFDGFTHLASPGDRAIKLHAERRYEPAFARPQMLWFHCIQPATSAGETVLCDGAELWARIPASIQGELLRNRLLYVLCFPSKVLRGAWPRHFATSASVTVSRAEAEAVMRRDPDVEYTFLDRGDILILKHLASAMATSRFDGRRAFANNLLTRHFASIVQFEDLTAIREEMLCEIEAIAESITFPVAWRAGDVMLIDNERVLHGRRAHSDPRRELHVRMGRDRLSH